MTLSAAERKFVIPAGAANHEVEARYTLKKDSTLTSLFPHMHLRGKDFEFRVVLPGGETQTLLKGPSYSFSWHLSYTLAQPLQLPKGPVTDCTPHSGNSVINKNIP